MSICCPGKPDQKLVYIILILEDRKHSLCIINDKATSKWSIPKPTIRSSALFIAADERSAKWSEEIFEGSYKITNNNPGTTICPSRISSSSSASEVSIFLYKKQIAI